MGKIRRMASEFQDQFQDAMREAEMADLKKQVDDMTNTATSVTNFDPLGDISKEFETAIEDKPAPTRAPSKSGALGRAAPSTSEPPRRPRRRRRRRLSGRLHRPPAETKRADAAAEGRERRMSAPKTTRRRSRPARRR